MKKYSIFHPFLFALSPILFLYSYNIDEVPLAAILPSIAIVISFTVLLLFLLRAILREFKIAALVTSLFLIWFFSYGHIYNIIEQSPIGDLKVARIRYILGVWSLLFIFAVSLVMKKRRAILLVTKFFNIISLILISTTFITISTYKVKESIVHKATNNPRQENITSIFSADAKSPRNIYYIILDGYSRSDKLKEVYNYDNSEFINYLRNKGFYVANKSMSNYTYTFLSLASSLNYKYIHYLKDTLGSHSQDVGPLIKMINNSKAIDFLKANGYRVVSFGGNCRATALRKKADIYLSFSEGGIFNWSQFEYVLLETTPLFIVDAFLNSSLRSSYYDTYRKKILYVFEHLPDTVTFKGPVFVFAHILSPHRPNVFGPNGQEIEPSDVPDRQGYIYQVAFMEEKVKEVIEKIIRESQTPPIIILQSDHGRYKQPDDGIISQREFQQKAAILNAYFLPGIDTKLLYEYISPVNTFRFVFNSYFNTNYSLLADESYWSTPDYPYDFTRIINSENHDKP